jgi:pectin methylesterase-like acyl-CoA thioesterase
MITATRYSFGFACGLLAAVLSGSTAAAALIPMEQVGPQPRAYSDKTPRSVALRSYAHVLHVAPGSEHKTVAAALAAVKDASAKKRYAILVAAGTYRESRIQMKPWVDLYGGYAPSDWNTRDVYQHATIPGCAEAGPRGDRGR